MSENQAKRWRRGKATQTNSNREIGRYFFSFVAIAVLAMLVALFWPKNPSINWVATFSSGPLDDLTPWIPFGEHDSKEWIPTKSTNVLNFPITELKTPSDIRDKIQKNPKSVQPSQNDNLVVYFVGYGITDHNQEPQFVIKPQIAHDSSKTDEQSENGIATAGNQISVKEMLESLVELRFKSILVVFDCSRTLNCPRWGWDQSNTFPKGLGNVVKALGSSTDQKSKTNGNQKSKTNANKLWVISASDASQLGLTLQAKERSLFGWAWHQSMFEAVKSSGKSSRQKSPVKLKDLISQLRESTKNFVANDKSPPLLFHGGHGRVDDLNYLSTYNPVIWYGDVASIESASDSSKEPVQEDLTKKEELAQQLESPEPEEFDKTLDKLKPSTELRELWSIWKRCEDIESGQVKNVPDQNLKQLLSPLVYAPHLWRRLKLQMVADECALLAKQTPTGTKDEYDRLLKRLEKWSATEPDSSSKTVCDQLKRAWYEYVTKSGKGSRTKNESKENAIKNAYQNYAHALFVFPELTNISNRLSTIANAKPLDRSFQEDLIPVAGLLSQFHEAAFGKTPTAELELEQRINKVIALGKQLNDWQVKAYEKWKNFGDVVAKDLRSENNPRSNWVTLELLLSSSVWKQQDRRVWRFSQSFLPAKTESKFEDIEAKRGPANYDEGIKELAGKFAKELVFPDKSIDFPKWYSELARMAKSLARKNSGNDAKAHLLAAICDPRDSELDDPEKKLFAIWFEPTLHPEAEPEYLSLIPTLPSTKTPVAGAKTEEPVLVSAPIDLDSGREPSGIFQFKLCWKPNHDQTRSQSTPPKVRLKAIFDKAWISPKLSEEYSFDNAIDEEGGVKVILVKWPVAMLDGVARRDLSHPSTSELKIEFDTEHLDEENRSREPQPRLQVDKEKKSVTQLVKLRNFRSVSLSLSQYNWKVSKRKGAEGEVFEVPLLAGRDGVLGWEVKNESLVDIEITAEIWPIDPPDESDRSNRPTYAWGRIPFDHKMDRKSSKLTDMRRIAVSKLTALKPGESKTISWEPPPAESQSDLPDTTHGIYCRLSLGNATDANPLHESKIEFVPRPPRKWLSAKGTVNSEASQNAAEFVATFGRQDDEWPWKAFSTTISPTFAISPIPNGWAGIDDAASDGIPGRVSARFKTIAGADDQQAFVNVDKWPRAFRWNVNVYPRADGPQKSSETRRLNFTQFALKSGSEKAGAGAKETSSEPEVKRVETSSRDSTRTPIAFRFTPSKEGPPPKLFFSLEADGLENSFSNPDGGACEELRIEQVFDHDKPKELFHRRADRNWSTKCRRDPEDPGKLLFNAELTDFNSIPLDKLEISEKRIRLQAKFYSGGTQQAITADDQNIQILFDGTPPTVEIMTNKPDSTQNERIVTLKVSDGDDFKPGSGVKEVALWLRTEPRKPLSAEELSIPDVSQDVKKDEVSVIVRVPTKHIPAEERRKEFYLIVRVKDGVGLEKKLESESFQLSPRVQNKGGADIGPNQKDGVIQGRLKFPSAGKEAGGFMVRITGAQSDDFEIRTSADGTFRFDKLTPDAEYTLSVKSQAVSRKTYGLSQDKKIKPSPAGKIKEEVIELNDLSGSKK